METTLEKELLNVGQVAGMLNICIRSVYRMADAGKMPRPVKLGSRVLWRRRELEKWIDAGCPPLRKGAA